MSTAQAAQPPKGKILLKLSRRELDLILREAAPALGLAEKISAPASERGMLAVRLSLGDWEEIAGYLSVQSYKGMSPKLQDQLDRVIERIEDLIDQHDEP